MSLVHSATVLSEHIFMLKSGNTLRQIRSLFYHAIKMTESTLANPIRILETHLICPSVLPPRPDTKRHIEVSAYTKGYYVTQGCLWLGHMQSERRCFSQRSVAHAMTLTTTVVLSPNSSTSPLINVGNNQYGSVCICVLGWQAVCYCQSVIICIILLIQHSLYIQTLHI